MKQVSVAMKQVSNEAPRQCPNIASVATNVNIGAPRSSKE
jgi:hypothetical protein